MNFQAFAEIGGFVVILGGLLWSAAYSRGRSDRIETDFGRQIDENSADTAKGDAESMRLLEQLRKESKDAIDAVWRWKQKHEEDAEVKRREYDREVTTIKVTLATNESFQKEILRRLGTLEEMLKEELRKPRA